MRLRSHGGLPALGRRDRRFDGCGLRVISSRRPAAVPAALSSGGAWVATTSLDSTTLTDGAHTVTATLRDGVGNQRAVIGAFAVDNTPPTVGITSPTAGAFVSRTITVEATAADATSGVASILIDVAGQHVAQCPSAPCSAISTRRRYPMDHSPSWPRRSTMRAAARRRRKSSSTPSTASRATSS